MRVAHNNCSFLLVAFAAGVAVGMPILAGADDIVVEGTRDDPEHTAAAVTVVPIDDRLPETADVADVVEGIAGTTVRRLGGLGTFSAVSIRGSTPRQVQVYLDGVPLNPDGASSVDLSELPLRAFARVEVYRSAPPPSFAAAPIGGVINLVSADEPPPWSLSAGIGSYGAWRLGATGGGRRQVGPLDTDGTVWVDALGARGGFRYFSDNGTVYNLIDDRIRRRENNERSQIAVHGRWRARVGRSELTLLEAWVHRDEGLPGHANAPSPHSGLATDRSLTVASWTTWVGAVGLTTRVWGHVRREVIDDPDGSVGAGHRRNAGNSGSVGALLDARWAPTAWLGTSATVSLRHDRFRETDLLADTTSAVRRRLAATASLAADLLLADDRVRIGPVVSLQVLDDRGLAVADGETPLAGVARRAQAAVDPRVGVGVRPVPWLLVRGTAGRYLRPPDLVELFGDSGVSHGNEELAPEHGTRVDGGIRLDGGSGSLRGNVDLGGFWSLTTDRIAWLQNAQKVLVPVNLDRARVHGLEAAVVADVLNTVDLQASATWTRSAIRTAAGSVDGNQLPRIPELELAARASVHHGDRVRAGWTFSWTDGNFWDATNWFRSAPRSLHGAFVRVRPIPGDAGLRGPAVELTVLNLTDRLVEVVRRNPLDSSDPSRMVQAITDFSGYPLPGRTFLVSLRWEAPRRGESP